MQFNVRTVWKAYKYSMCKKLRDLLYSWPFPLHGQPSRCAVLSFAGSSQNKNGGGGGGKKIPGLSRASLKF